MEKVWQNRLFKITSYRKHHPTTQQNNTLSSKKRKNCALKMIVMPWSTSTILSLAKGRFFVL
jgi:hypothetical protein